MKLCFATNNRHKIEEVQKLLGNEIELVSLEEIGCREELPENQEALEGNALEKAQYVWQHFGVSCFADDTGLEVEALEGAPGVYSARYAGTQRDNTANIQLLLQNLHEKPNRKAQFRTVMALILDGKSFLFEGIVEGFILEERRGEGGFGYDSVFRPEGFAQTFAEMGMDEKNKISHRGRAMQKLVEFLKQKTK
jgi:XTP/dITP diphosphohydrolase